MSALITWSIYQSCAKNAIDLFCVILTTLQIFSPPLISGVFTTDLVCILSGDVNANSSLEGDVMLRECLIDGGPAQHY